MRVERCAVGRVVIRRVLAEVRWCVQDLLIVLKRAGAGNWGRERGMLHHEDNIELNILYEREDHNSKRHWFVRASPSKRPGDAWAC